MRRALILFAAVTNLVFADALVKQIAVVRLRGAAAVCVIPNVFHLAYVENRGCAWGMFQGHVWPLAAFALVALAFLLWKHRSVFGDGRLGAVAEPLLYAGILGNLADRILRGFVVDMFDFHWGASHFPCFNLADTYICVAAGLLILSSFLARPVDANFRSRQKKDGAALTRRDQKIASTDNSAS